MAEPKISLGEVKHVARLARLALSPEDEMRMRAELDGILAYIDKLRAVDVDGVPPTSHAVPLTNVMRDDEPRPSLPLDEMLANAPDRARRLLPRAEDHRGIAGGRAHVADRAGAGRPIPAARHRAGGGGPRLSRAHRGARSRACAPT